MTQTQHDDVLLKAYSQLTSLQELLTNNLRGGFVREQYVHEYHNSLAKLEAVGYDVTDFRIPSSELRKRAITKNPITGQVFMTEQREVEHGILLLKLRAVLEYFTLIQRRPQQKIGFDRPSKAVQ